MTTTVDMGTLIVSTPEVAAAPASAKPELP